MVLELWTSRKLYRALKDDRFESIPSHFRDTYFSETHFSGEKDIIWANLPIADRRMAPFVLPTEQGKPIFRAAPESVKAISPPYMKPKDPVRAVDAKNPRISELLRDAPMGVAERFNARVIEVSEYHIRAIEMRKAHMAARALIDAKVLINYERDQGTAFPEVLLDFNRDAGHTVVKGSAYWNDTATLILDDIEMWGNTMAAAAFGGPVKRVYVGSAVAPWVKKNLQVRAELDTQRRGTAVDIQTGIVFSAGVHNPLVYLGTVGAGIEVWAYTDKVQQADGTWVDILGPKDVLLVADGATGVMAYGAIWNAKAIQQGVATSTDVFPSMWVSDDPADVLLMHESAPLPIPLYPNRTFKATVLP